MSDRDVERVLAEWGMKTALADDGLKGLEQYFGACADAPVRSGGAVVATPDDVLALVTQERDALRAEVEKLRRVAEAASPFAAVVSANRTRYGRPLDKYAVISAGYWADRPYGGREFAALVRFTLADFEALETALAALEAEPA